MPKLKSILVIAAIALVVVLFVAPAVSKFTAKAGV